MDDSVDPELLRRQIRSRLFINDSLDSTVPDPIIGYAQEPLLPLKQACAPLIHIVHDIVAHASVALEHTPAKPANGLTRDESASIRLYTMEWSDHRESLYSILNHTLRHSARQNLRPWFKYLKLFLTALVKIPCSPLHTVWRGIRINISDAFPPGEEVTWWSFSSCTTNLNVLQSNLYLGDEGGRTLFSIELFNGRIIRPHSQFDIEDEVLMLPGTCMEVQSQFNPASDLHVVHLKQMMPKEVLLELPFEDAFLYPNMSPESVIESPQHCWYLSKRFLFSIISLTIVCIVAIILGSVLGSRSSAQRTEITTKGCPTNAWNICVFNTRVELNSEGYYGSEFVDIDCNQDLSNITVIITVQKTLGATYTKQYNSFLPINALVETHYETSSQIFYVWTAMREPTIDFSRSPYYVNAQFQLTGASQMVENDTYSVVAHVACNGKIITRTGHF